MVVVFKKQILKNIAFNKEKRQPQYFVHYFVNRFLSIHVNSLFMFLYFLLDWNSALFIILNGTKEEHLDMLDGGIIQRLLEEKWKTFARVTIKNAMKKI